MATFPQINLNGTSADNLLQLQLDVVNAIRKAEEAMSLAAPHGRDYQTLPDGTYQKAREEWVEQVKALNAISAHFWAMAMEINRQQAERNKK